MLVKRVASGLEAKTWPVVVRSFPNRGDVSNGIMPRWRRLFLPLKSLPSDGGKIKRYKLQVVIASSALSFPSHTVGAVGIHFCKGGNPNGQNRGQGTHRRDDGVRGASAEKK